MIASRLPLLLGAAAAPLLLAACGGAAGGGAARPVTAGMRPATDAHQGAGAAARGSADAVMGQNAAQLIRRFGQPRLDITEGAGHKLQFTSDRCVLDAYLYPQRQGSEPIVTHVDARSPTGEDVDRAACIATLGRR